MTALTLNRFNKRGDGHKLWTNANKYYQVLADTPVLAFYFSAHWCPPCRQFTPVLARVHAQARQAASAPRVEVVFVSSDRSEAEMLSYMRESHGDWLAVPHGSPEVAALSARFGVRGIPALVVATRDGEEVTREGRQEVSSLGVSALATWNQVILKQLLSVHVTKITTLGSTRSRGHFHSVTSC